MFDFKIVTKSQFTLVGCARRFNSKTSYQEIPKFWHEIFMMGSSIAYGMYGVCYDCGSDGNFRYMIADVYNAKLPVPDGAEVITIPARTWAVFPCIGPSPKALQEVNTYIFNEWLPNSKQYRMVGDLNVESYCEVPPKNVPDEEYCEIWIPVEEI